MIITKFTVTGDLVYRISFRHPEPINGFVGYVSITACGQNQGFCILIGRISVTSSKNGTSSAF